MTEPAITPELVAKHNLTPDEYQKILDILGRPPSYTELGIFSVDDSSDGMSGGLRLTGGDSDLFTYESIGQGRLA